ncbi:aldehyde dehydrogenase family protein [Pseudorhodoferax sp.]|uniref:aldehyde dehydrogenase family protein n=1 Tax=Pseudorhodoferax sp. TaxID=1993553 RepID=UPI002DD675A7|nr:aldehyde dehydrogenase family protein [Pseudorhodoferax sp.]
MSASGPACEVFYAAGAFHRSGGCTQAVVVNPATAEPAGAVTLCSHDDLDLALRSARQAQPRWAASSLEERRQLLQRLHDALAARGEAVVASLAREIGCPVWLGRSMQVPMALKGLILAAEGLAQVRWQETIGNGVVERVPVGVVAAITPWNFPLHQIAAKVAGALAAGCAVVIKPSEVAPGAALAFVEAVHEAGVPAGLVNLVWGGADIGAALVEDERVDQVSFTGSTAVGRRVMAAAAARLARVTLELGGKSAAVLLDDADLDVALPVVLRMALANSGQACVSQSRVVVPRARLAEVQQRLVSLCDDWPVGDPLDEATRLGPVATGAQLAQVDRMVRHAIDQGAQVLCGGPGPLPSQARGFYVAPTLLGGVHPGMAVAQQEVFGPVLAVLAADDDADAVRLANATAYGLSGAVWSCDVARAAAVARQMRTGQVVINGAAQNLATPFGGWGHSGFGRENGRFGIEECLQYRALHGLAA